ILNSCIDIIAFPTAYWQLKRVNYVKDSDGYKSCNIEPDCNIHVLLSSFYNSSEHINPEYYPNYYNCNVNRPFHFSIFMRRCKTHCQGNYRCNNNCLPTPEMYFT